MPQALKYATLGCLLAATLALGDCVKFRQVITVLPDGSGKIEFRMGLSEQVLALAQQDGDDPFEEMNPETLAEAARGIVAFSEPVIEEAGGYTYTTFNAYFEDINDVELVQMGDGEPAEYVFQRDGDEASLVVTGGLILSMIAEYEPSDPNEADQIRALMAGMSIEEHYVLPGTVGGLQGVEVDGSTVPLVITIDDLVDGKGLIETLEGTEALWIEVDGVDGFDAAAIEAFRAEMEAAIEAWEENQ